MTSAPPPPGPTPPGPPPGGDPYAAPYTTSAAAPWTGQAGRPAQPGRLTQPGQPAYGVKAGPGGPGPVEPVPFHRIHRLGSYGRNGWWRGLVGTIVVVAAMFLVVPLLLLVGFFVFYAATGGDAVDRTFALADLTEVTPASLAYLNLSLAAAIPVVWLVNRVLHGLRPGWLSSVAPRIRWRWFAVSLGLAVIALIATVLVSAVLPAQGGGPEVNGAPNTFTSTTRDFLLVILLLTPLQAAGEEYAFRGYLTQAIGGIVRSPRLSAALAVLVPATLFALAHGAQDAPIFIDRLAFGIVAGVLTIATGGLEAGIAMHVLNNFLAFGLALAFTDMTSALNPVGGSWWNLPVTLTQSLVYAALAVVVARRMGITTRTTPPDGDGRGGVLEASGARV